MDEEETEDKKDKQDKTLLTTKKVKIKKISFSHPLVTKTWIVPWGIKHRYFNPDISVLDRCVSEAIIQRVAQIEREVKTPRKRTADMELLDKRVSKKRFREQWNGNSLVKEGQKEPPVIKKRSTLSKDIFDITFGQLTASMNPSVYRTLPNIAEMMMDIWKGRIGFNIKEHFKAGHGFLTSANVYDEPEISLGEGKYSVSLFVSDDQETVKFENLPWHSSGWYTIDIPAQMYKKDSVKIDARLEFELGTNN